MSDSDPGAGNLCNYVLITNAGLYVKAPILRAYD